MIMLNRRVKNRSPMLVPSGNINILQALGSFNNSPEEKNLQTEKH